LTGVYNAVAVESSDATLPAPVSAVVYQSDGPLRWQSGFHRVRRFASPVLRTPEACQAAGLTILARSQIFAQQVEPTVTPNPALDAGDTVTLAIDGVPSGARVLSELTVSLDAGSARMAVKTRVGLSGVGVAAAVLATVLSALRQEPRNNPILYATPSKKPQHARSRREVWFG
jgi:hypothetical protein